MPTPIDPLLMAAAHANYREALRAMARITPAGTIRERGGVSFIATGIPAAFLNPVMTCLPPRAAEVVVDEARAFYGPRELPWQVTAWGLAAAAFDAHHPGLRATGTTPGMLRTSLDGDPPAARGLEIRPVRDMDTLDVYARVLCEGFDMPREWAAFLAQPAFIATIDQTAYLGFAGGVPVATALRVTSHRIAGVFNISTIPSARGRGFGEAMTWAATLGGRDEVCIAAYLQATPAGRSIYERMGFVHVADYHHFEPLGQAVAH